MGIPGQVIAENYIPTIRQYDLSDLEPGEQWEKIDGLFQETIRMPFDLEGGPLLHLSLVMMSPAAHLLLVGLPALCSDSASLENLIDEINRTYEACLLGEELSDEPLQYADIAEWQRQLLGSEGADIGGEYWLKQDLTQLAGIGFRVKGQDLGATEFDPRFIRLTIDSDLAAGIEALIREHETTAFIFYLACWQILLGRLTGRSKIIVGTAFDGRNYQGLGQALGLFAKYLPISCYPNDGLLFGDLLKQVDELIRDAYESQEYFFWGSLEEIGDHDIEPRYFPLSYEFKEHSAFRSTHQS